MAAGTKNTKHLVRSQLPEFIADDYPKFVEFLQAYYQFTTENYNVDIEALRDPDGTADKLLIFLRRELLKNFPNSVIDERKLLSSVRQVYSRKGNMDGIKLLFKLFFNEAVIIRQPGEQILRASDAAWIQSNIITVAQLKWDDVVTAISRAAAGAEPEADLFNSTVTVAGYGTYKVGDIDHTGTIQHTDSTIVAKYSLNPISVTQSQKDHIEKILIPALMSNPAFAGYTYSSLDETLIIPEVSKIVIENSLGRFTPTITGYEFEENQKIRLFFDTNRTIQVETGQMISITGATGNIIFTGRHAQTPSGIKVTSPGANWQRGQVITIPGTIKPTVGRVAEVDANFGIKRIEILEYGGTHDENQALIVSPYPTKPLENSSWSTETTVTAINPGTGIPTAFLHTLTIEDYVESVKDELYGEKDYLNFGNLSNEIINASNGIQPAVALFNIIQSGFKLGDVDHNGSILAADARQIDLYVAGQASATAVSHIETILVPKLRAIVQSIKTTPPITPYSYTSILYSIVTPPVPVISVTTVDTNSVRYNYSELSMAEWLESRATLYFTRDDIVKTKGAYLNDRSQISNTESRLQDNYFYQLFSYLIETTKSGEDVTYILNQFHPAGMKYFFQLFKQATYSIRDILEGYRSLSNDVVFALDILGTSEYEWREFTKILNDVFDMEEVLAKSFTKIVAGVNQVTMNDSVAKNFTKIRNDATTASLTRWNVATKILNDTPAASDAVNSINTLKILNDTPAPSDVLIKLINKDKYNDPADVVSINGGTFNSVTSTGYALDYFAEQYSVIALDIQIN